MAVGKPAVGKPFAKGKSGNPQGGSKMLAEMRTIKRLTQQQVSEIGSLILSGDKAALRDIGQSPKSSILQVWMAGLIVRSMQDGDAGIFRAVMDRVVGKPREFKEITGPDGGPLMVARMETEQEKLERIEQLRALRATLVTGS